MIMYIALMVICEIISAFSQMLLKRSTLVAHESRVKEYFNINVITGYFFLMIAMLIAIYCYGKIGYMNVIIIEPLGYIFVLILSRIFFKELLHWRKCAGSGLIILGIYVFYML